MRDPRSLPGGAGRLGLFGGSFNPVHHGHLVTAARAAEEARLDRVLFIPTAVTPLKAAGGLAQARDRLAMLRLALRGNSRFQPWDLEVRRGGVSYTVDTLRALRKRTGAALFLILGEDAFRLLPLWRSIDEVKRMVTFVVAARSGRRPRLRMPKQLMVEVPRLEISGTEIRLRARRGLSIRYLVPDAVERYILRKGLYC